MYAPAIALNSNAQQAHDICNKVGLHVYLNCVHAREPSLFEAAVRKGVNTCKYWPLVCLDVIEHWSERWLMVLHSFTDMQVLAKLSGMDDFNDNDTMNASILRYIREHLTLSEIAERPTVQFLCRVLANVGGKGEDSVCTAYLLAQAHLERLTGSDKQLLIVAMLMYLRRSGQDYQAYAELCESAKVSCNMYLSTATLAYDLILNVSDDENMAMCMFTPTIVNDVLFINLSVKLVYVLHSIFLQEYEILDIPVFTRPRCQPTICANCHLFCNNASCRALDTHFKRCEQCPEGACSSEPRWSFELDEPEIFFIRHRLYPDLVERMILAHHSMLFIIRVMLLSFDEHGVSERFTASITIYARHIAWQKNQYTPNEIADFIHQIQLKLVFEVAVESYKPTVCETLADMLVASGGSARVRDYILAHRLNSDNWRTLVAHVRADDVACGDPAYAFLFGNQKG